MKAISIKQPWASAIVHGTKRIENRAWVPKCELPVRIAIHASQTALNDADQVLVDLAPIDDELPVTRGAIIGFATVTGFITDADFADADQVPWFIGPFGWLLEDVEALPEPILAKGKLGLWDCDEYLK